MGTGTKIVSHSPNLEPERSELKAVLDSGIFDRAPHLEQLLKYICSKYFEGAADQLKEYNIAVEAFGRSSDFDPKRDSIVRVEAHRLRKRLGEYYAKDGASHAVHIVVPAGRYTPKFLVQNPVTAMTPVENSLQPQQAAVEFEMVRPWYQRHSLGVVILLVVFIGALVTYLARVRGDRNLNRDGVRAAGAELAIPAVAGKGSEVRILAGNEKNSFVDGYGRTWQADRYFTGGTAFNQSNHPILMTRDSGLYENRREGIFRYDIPLQPGTYELRLHFAETLFGETNTAGGGETSRLFNVFANDQQILSELDVTQEVGASTADVKVFKDISPAWDGKLHLRFETVNNPAVLNAIEITPGTPGAMQPIRMVSRESAWIDREGQRWEPDRLARGGQLVKRTVTVSGTPEPELHRGERFGNLTYTIPVAPGRYRLSLHFAETWFGPNSPGRGGVDSRVFDILCNGIALARNFDIYREAGGANRALVRTFHNLQPNAQGKLVVSLVPIRNYACINAIEIADESR